MGATDMKVVLLEPGTVEMAWKDLAPLIQMGVDESMGEMRLVDIKTSLLAGTSMVLCAMENKHLYAVAVVNCTTFPSGKKVFGITCLGGEEMSDWVDAMDEAIVNMAKAQECGEVRIVGRPGWAKALKGLGWGHTHTILSKRI